MTSGGAHLRDLAPGQHRGGDGEPLATIYNLTGPVILPRTSPTDSDVFRHYANYRNLKQNFGTKPLKTQTHFLYVSALEVVAGGRLYNVVVDNNETGAKLLKNGQLQRRCTIIPLNKIAARSLNADVSSCTNFTILALNSARIVTVTSV